MSQLLFVKRDDTDFVMPIPSGVSILFINIGLPEGATDEQRQAYLQELRRLGGKSVLAIVMADAGVAPEVSESFVSDLQERFGEDGHVTLIPSGSTVKANVPPLPLMS